MPVSVMYMIDFMLFKMGTENHVVDLLSGIDKNKYCPILVAFRCSEEMRKKVESLGIKVIEVKIDKIYGIKEFYKLFQLRGFIRREKIKIIHTFHINPDIYGTVLAKISNVPIVISSRRDMGYLRKKNHVLCYKLLSRYVDKIICVSKAVKNIFMNEDRIPENKFCVIYNGIDQDKFDKKIDIVLEKARNGLKESELVVGVLANFGEVKGHAYFIEAAKKIRARYNNAGFILAGEGRCKSKMQIKSKELGLDDCVHFLGHRDDVPELLSVINILVAPSLSEGFSNTIIEALYMKKPVVATNVGGNPEIIINDETGILIEPADSEAIADAVISLFSDYGKARKLGENGKAIVEKKFTLKNTVKQTEDLYQKLLIEKGLE